MKRNVIMPRIAPPYHDEKETLTRWVNIRFALTKCGLTMVTGEYYGWKVILAETLLLWRIFKSSFAIFQSISFCANERRWPKSVSFGWRMLHRSRSRPRPSRIRITKATHKLNLSLSRRPAGLHALNMADGRRHVEAVLRVVSLILHS